MVSETADEPRDVNNDMPVQGVWTDTSPHPWRRYMGRTLDNVLVGCLTWILVALIAYILAPGPTAAVLALLTRPVGQFLSVILLALFNIPANALLLRTTGFTLGKWVFGVRVTRDGERLSFRGALRREAAVFVRGIGLGIPLIAVVTAVFAYRRLTSQGMTSWDRDQDLTIFHRPVTRASMIYMWLAAIGTILFVYAIRLLAGP
jgi:uncharacterized RDD family membrane protein YckC